MYFPQFAVGGTAPVSDPPASGFVVTAVVVYTTVRKQFVTLLVYCDTDRRSRYRRERVVLLVIA